MTQNVEKVNNLPSEQRELAPAERLALSNIGLAALRGGVSLIPIGKNKKPAWWVLPVQKDEQGNPVLDEKGHEQPTWKPYQYRRPTEQELRAWMADSDARGLATVCGAISGGLLIIDFDIPRFYDAWLKLVGGVTADVPVQQTGGGGYQVVVRCANPGANDKLAWAPDDTNYTGRTIAIETRGEGGYALVPGSLHPENTLYTLLQGDYANIPFVDQETVDRWLQAARELDEMPLTKQEMSKAPVKSDQWRTERGSEQHSGDDVIGAYNAKYTICEVLERNGYQRDGDRYIRPDGESASVMLLPDAKNPKYSYHFSSDDPLDDRHQHDAFDVFRILEHNEDWTAAVRAAAEDLGMAHTRSQKEKHNLSDEGADDTREAEPDEKARVRAMAWAQVERIRAEAAQDAVQAAKEAYKAVKLWAQLPISEYAQVKTDLKAILGDKLNLNEFTRAVNDARAENKPDDEVWAALIADAITKHDHFAQDAGEHLYVWSGGVYVDHGAQYVKKRVRELLEAWEVTYQWSSHLANEVVAYLLTKAPTLWERPPLDAINVLNGLLDVQTRTLRPHSPDWLSTVQLPIRYDPAARCPGVEKFCTETLSEDAQEVMWQLAAWLMLPETGIQKSIVLVGEGGNGKSTFLAVLRGFLGKKNVSTMSLYRMSNDRFSASGIVGKLANICADLPSKDLQDTSIFLEITGGDSVTLERKNEPTFDYTPFCRLIFSAKKPPESSEDKSIGFFQRWILVPFNRTYRDTAEEIPFNILVAALTAPEELSGMLNKALDALSGVRDNGITVTRSMQETWNKFYGMNNPLAQWLAEIVEDDAPRSEYVTKGDLYRLYKQDKQNHAISEKSFAGALHRVWPDWKEREKQRTVDGKVVWVWLGVRWKYPVKPVPPDQPGGGEKPTLSRDSRDSANCSEFENTYPLEAVSQGGEGGVSIGTDGNKGKPRESRESREPGMPAKPVQPFVHLVRVGSTDGVANPANSRDLLNAVQVDGTSALQVSVHTESPTVAPVPASDTPQLTVVAERDQAKPEAASQPNLPLFRVEWRGKSQAEQVRGMLEVLGWSRTETIASGTYGGSPEQWEADLEKCSKDTRRALWLKLMDYFDLEAAIEAEHQRQLQRQNP